MVALGSFTEMGFLRTSDFREGNEMVFFLMKLAFRENGIVVEKVDFKLSKNSTFKLTTKRMSLGALGH